MLKLKKLNVWNMTQENVSKKIDVTHYDISLHFEHQNYLPFVVEIDNSTWGWKNNKNSWKTIAWTPPLTNVNKVTKSFKLQINSRNNASEKNYNLLSFITIKKRWKQKLIYI